MDNSDVWREKYKQTFSQVVPRELTQVLKLSWREFFFYRSSAEKNMASSRPKYTVR